MIDYSEMSDYEINWRVAEELGLSVDHNAAVTLPQTYCGHDEDGCKYGWGMKDYCNNPADAWRIIVNNKISIVIDDTTNLWSSSLVQDFCDNGAFKHANCHESPLRAAMIVFLMMKDADK